MSSLRRGGATSMDSTAPLHRQSDQHSTRLRFPEFYFSISRCLALKALVTMYGSSTDYTVIVKMSALSLGFFEDFVCTTYFASALWIFDTFKQMALERIVYRDMRFSFGLLATLIRERHHLKDAPISSDEVQAAYVTAGYLVIIAALFALVRTWASWADLALWNPTQIVPNPVNNTTNGNPYAALNVTLNELLLHMFEPAPIDVDYEFNRQQTWVEKFSTSRRTPALWRRYALQTHHRIQWRSRLQLSIDSDNPPNILIIEWNRFGIETRAISWRRRPVRLIQRHKFDNYAQF
ncbi:hypothetical protein GQ600_5824 [Phytophthora cactorum]|nr:hypothetical protein GQ600_5824 [Phytophthora cactorum]